MLQKIIAKIQARRTSSKQIKEQQAEDSRRRNLRYDNLGSEEKR